MTNEERAAMGKAALDAFMEASGLTEDDGYETALTDLLADLMHFCHNEPGMYEDANESADMHYTAKIDEEATA